MGKERNPQCGMLRQVHFRPYHPGIRERYLETGQGSTEEEVYKTVELLGFSKDNITTRDVEGIYNDYGHDVMEIKELKLEEERK